MDQLGLGDIFDELGISKDYKSGQKEQLNFMRYLQLVDWKEPWLVTLILCHLIMFAIVIRFRNVVSVQSTLGLIMLGIVYMSENINELAAEHWRYFSAHQYFDSKGFFISTVLSAPLLINCLIIVINFLLQNYYMLKDIRRMKVSKNSSSRKDNPSKSSDKVSEDKQSESTADDTSDEKSSSVNKKLD